MAWLKTVEMLPVSLSVLAQLEDVEPDKIWQAKKPWINQDYAEI